MRAGLPVLFFAWACAVLATEVCGVNGSWAHSERPGPILRIDRRLTPANEHSLSARRESRLLLKRARFSRQNGDAAAALADLARARELGSEGRFLEYELGLTLAMLGRDAEARAHLDRFLGSGTPNALALNARARIRERAGDLERAAADYTASLALRDDVEVYLARGRVLESLHRCEQAAEGYRAGLARLGKADLIEKALVSALAACGKHDAALATIDAHLRAGPDTTEWLLLRGDILSASGDAAGARAARERALASAEQALSRKRTALLYYQRARVHAALGHTSDARADLERVLSTSSRFQPALDLAKALDVATDAVPDRKRAQNDSALEGQEAGQDVVASKE